MLCFIKLSQILTIVLFWFCTSALETRSPSIHVSLIKVHKYGVEIDWHLKKAEQPANWGKLINCELVYGPVHNSQQVYVLPYSPDFNHHNHSGGHIFELVNLSPNAAYRFHMICYNNQGKKYYSDSLIFTTGVKIQSKPAPGRQKKLPQKKPSYVYIAPNEFVDDEEDRPNTPSSNVILGAVCGIVGFLIINITVVMAVRKYSHRQLRRRHMLGLDDRDYDGLQYVPDIQ